MRQVLATSNAEVLRLLGSGVGHRLGLARTVAASGLEALELARRLHPCLAILDVDLPDLDGCEVCERLKRDPALGPVTVMLVASSPPALKDIQRLRDAEVDDFLVVPVDPTEFTAHLIDLLGLRRRRSPRLPLPMVAWARIGTQGWAGQVEDLSLHGVRLRLERPLAPVEALSVRLVPPSGPDTVLDARVVWRGAGDHVAGLEFTSVTGAQRQWLHMATRWAMVEDGGVLHTYVPENLDEGIDLDGLRQVATRRLDFDASGVRHVNSHGAWRWAEGLRGLDGVERYTFSRCSLTFVAQATQVGDFLGRGEVVSFISPYHCDECDHEETRLLQVAAVAPALAAREPPRFRCQRCGGRLLFDDIPDRYLLLLERG